MMKNIPSPGPMLTRTNTLVAADGYLEFVEIKEEDDVNGKVELTLGNGFDTPTTGKNSTINTIDKNGDAMNGNIDGNAVVKKPAPLITKLSSTSLGKLSLSGALSYDGSSRPTETTKKRVRLCSNCFP